MHQGAILFKKKDCTIPEAILKAYCEQYKTVLGYAVVGTGLEYENRAASATPEILQELQNIGDDVNMVFYLGDYPVGFQHDDMQPFLVLEDKDKNPAVVAFLDGDFVGYTHDKSTHSPEFFVANYLSQKLKRMYQSCGQDMAKFEAELDDPLTQQEISNTGASFVNILLFLSTGKVVIVSKGGVSESFEWGWINNNQYIKEYPPKTEESPRAMTHLEKMKAAKAARQLAAASGTPPAAPEKPAEAAPPASPPPAPDEKKEAPTTVPAVAGPPKNETRSERLRREKEERESRERSNAIAAKVAAKAEGTGASATALAANGDKDFVVREVEMTCPKDIQGKKGRRYWFKQHAGFIPPNYMDVPGPVVKVKIREAAKSFAAAAESMASKASVRSGEPQLSDQPLPLIPPKEKAEFLDKVYANLPKFTDEKRNELMNPTKVPTMEVKVPSFAEQLGLKGLEEVFWWSFASLDNLTKNYPRLAAVLLNELRFQLMKHYIEELEEDALIQKMNAEGKRQAM